MRVTSVVTLDSVLDQDTCVMGIIIAEMGLMK